jgi:hypothetical protein
LRDPSAWRRIERDRAVANHGENLCSEPPEIREAWDVTAAVLVRMSDACVRGGARLVVFAVPARAEVNPRAAAELRASLAGAGVGDTCVDAPAPPASRRLAAILADLEIELIDLVPAFRGAKSGPLFHDIDLHWNARGHAIAAREVADALHAELAAPR